MNRKPFALDSLDDGREQRFGIAIHAGPDHRHFLLSGSLHIGCQALVPVNDLLRLGSPYHPMAGGDDLDVQAIKLRYAPEDKRGEGGDDIGIVALGFACQMHKLLFALFVIETLGISSERAECITTEQDSILNQKGHHGLRPMDVRSHEELQCLSPKVERLSVLDGTDILLDLVEVLDQVHSLVAAQDLNIGILFHNLGH